MQPIEKIIQSDLVESLTRDNILAFILLNQLKNENGSLIEFRDHYFMIQPYLDMSPNQAHRKCSQIGGSVKEIIKSVYVAKHLRANIIYTMPTRNAIRDFVLPKVDPILQANPALSSMIAKTNSIDLKRVGDRFIYYRGSWAQESAISISAHVVINDEKDRSNPKVIRTYNTRLDDAKRERPDLGWIWNLSNPTIPDSGVDTDYQNSCQYHWFVKCPHCNYEWFMSFPENIDFKREIYVCTKCGKELDREARRTGRWVNKRVSDTAGYWYSQMFVPWIPASKIIKDYNGGKGDQSVFFNFTLGLPYQGEDTGVTREDIVGILAPGSNPQIDNAMGVDNGVVKHVVIGNRYGIFKTYYTDDWDEIERDRNIYNATMVIDANPYPNVPTKLVKKYPGKVFIHYYDTKEKNLDVVTWGEGDRRGVVYSNRTKIFDIAVADIRSRDLEVNMTLTAADEYIVHWTNMYRVVEEDAAGRMKAKWKTKGEDTGTKRPDHYAHSTIYFLIALMKSGVSGAIVKNVEPKRNEVKNPTVSREGTIPAYDTKALLERINKKGKSWKVR